MLKEITIENYKSLKNAKVEFKDGLNIIIGKNGSGKSNLLEFIDDFTMNFLLKDIYKPKKTLSNDFSYSLEVQSEESFFIKFHTKNTQKINEKKGILEQNSEISVQYIDKKTLMVIRENEYDFFDTTLSRMPSEDFSRLTPFLFSISKVNFSIPNDLAWLYTPEKYQIEFKEILILENDFDNFNFSLYLKYHFQLKLIQSRIIFSSSDLVEKIRKLLFNEFDKFKLNVNVDKNLNSFSPITEIRINPNVNIYKIENKILIENLTVEFRVNDIWLPWSYLSDGTKRLFYIISEICCQKEGLILIEEPELGIHPHQLFKLMQFIKEQSETNQIIISTHSPIVLDALSPDELDRIIIAKFENGSSRFSKLTEEQIIHAKKYMEDKAELSYYWLHSDLEEND